MNMTTPPSYLESACRNRAAKQLESGDFNSCGERKSLLYDLESRCVMVFDEFGILAEIESERHVVDWEGTYQLTRHFHL